MTGRTLFIGIGIFLILFAIGLFYTTNHAYYDREFQETAQLQGLDIQNYDAIDAPTSPIKYRACFATAAPDEFIRQFAQTEDATPLIAPYWFKCFDAEQLAKDIETGKATPVLTASNNAYGIDEYAAIYPDGRGYAWKQLNECGEKYYGGKDLPANCPKKE